jgi:hypothetical protein
MSCVALGVGRMLDELEVLEKVAPPLRLLRRFSSWPRG